MPVLLYVSAWAEIVGRRRTQKGHPEKHLPPMGIKDCPLQKPDMYASRDGSCQEAEGDVGLSSDYIKQDLGPQFLRLSWMGVVDLPLGKPWETHLS